MNHIPKQIENKAKIFTRTFCILLVLFFPSPVISSAANVSHSFLIIPFGILLFFWNLIRGISKSIAALSLFIISWGLLASLLAQSKSQIGISILITTSIIIAEIIKRSATEENTIATMNKFMMAILIGAWISVVYFLLNGNPVLTIQNPDSRDNNLFLTSFSNSSDYDFWGIIRPSGIYDEPGALSFGVTIIVILNEIINPRRKYSLIMMLLGLVTLSVTHALITAIYVFYYIFKFNWIPRLITLILLSAPLIVIVNNLPSDSVLAMNFINRFVIEDGSIRGDNRSSQVEIFFKIVKNDIEISTRGHQAITNDSSTKRYTIDQSSNPFSMWFNYGLLMWAIYFTTMLYILFMTIKYIRTSNIFISGVLLFIILLQRPFIHDSGWGVAVWLLILLISQKSDKAQKYIMRNPIAIIKSY